MIQVTHAQQQGRTVSLQINLGLAMDSFLSCGSCDSDFFLSHLHCYVSFIFICHCHLQVQVMLIFLNVSLPCNNKAFSFWTWYRYVDRYHTFIVSL